MKREVLKKTVMYFKSTIEFETEEEFRQKNEQLTTSIQLDLDNVNAGYADYRCSYVSVEDNNNKYFPHWLFD